MKAHEAKGMWISCIVAAAGDVVLVSAALRTHAPGISCFCILCESSQEGSCPGQAFPKVRLYKVGGQV